MASNAADVIQAVRAPLGLAALALLVAAWAWRDTLRRKGRPNADSRAIIRYGFITGLVLGVMAVAAYLITGSYVREVRISGTVRDESGAPLPFVAVRVAGKGGGVTEDSGDFVFTIPDSRAADSYTLEVFRDGYQLERVPLQGRTPAPVSVTLKRASVPIGALVHLGSPAVIRHFLGVPVVEVTLLYQNPTHQALSITEIAASLVSPSGITIPLSMSTMAFIPGQPVPPLTNWPLPADGSASILYQFVRGNDGFVQLQQRVAYEVRNLPASTQPDPAAHLLSDALVHDLRDFMNSQFVWAPGTWQLHVGYRVGDQQVDLAKTFSLSADDERHMRAIASYYPAGLGVFPNWSNWQRADANPSLTIALGDIGPHKASP